MRDALFRLATPLTAGLFLVSTVSGVALFLGWQPGLFHEMHEVLSMVLLAPVAVHVWRNWRGFVAYFGRWAMPVSLAASVVAAGAFAYAARASMGGVNPALALMNAASEAPIAELAPLLHLEQDAIAGRLAGAGFGSVEPDDTVAAIAARNAVPTRAVMGALTAP